MYSLYSYIEIHVNIIKYQFSIPGKAMSILYRNEHLAPTFINLVINVFCNAIKFSTYESRLKSVSYFREIAQAG